MISDRLSDYAFDFPKELIASRSPGKGKTQILHCPKDGKGPLEIVPAPRIVEFFRPGDCIVVNNTKVIPARLFGVKEQTEAKIEILLLKRRENDVWETLVKPGKKAKIGTRIIFGDGLLVGEIIDVVEEGNRLIQFSYEGIFEEILDKLGQMPLPP